MHRDAMSCKFQQLRHVPQIDVTSIPPALAVQCVASQ